MGHQQMDGPGKTDHVMRVDGAKADVSYLRMRKHALYVSLEEKSAHLFRHRNGGNGGG